MSSPGSDPRTLAIKELEFAALGTDICLNRRQTGYTAQGTRSRAAMELAQID